MNSNLRHRVLNRPGIAFASVLLGLAMAMGAVFPAQAATLAQAQQAWPADAYVVRVDGLACPFCAYGIEKQFSHLPGVTTTDVNLANGVVVVHVKPGTHFDQAQINKTVQQAGFTLKAVMSQPAGGH
ncbi:heavy metal-associated domain-containing protein [Rhodanobacter sp. OR444]|uniref:heavy-metal-associated domain-containing protein n=1 Tax=Rhodanobacter sp. OR444 TaxID=1076525 RepID=UPI000427CA52|nr:heavy metal-associated domain-containing protein [Rhodanobacter sp. OR444]